MNKIWGWMLIIGIAVGLLTGKSAEVSTALVESAKTGVNHAIGMAGVVAMWSGIMRLAEAEGLLDILTRKMEGLIHFLFPHIPEGHPAEKYISLNFAANVLGLGWAATPAGLSAMEALEQLEGGRRVKRHPLAMEAGTASRQPLRWRVSSLLRSWGGAHEPDFILVQLYHSCDYIICGRPWPEHETGYF